MLKIYWSETFSDRDLSLDCKGTAVLSQYGSYTLLITCNLYVCHVCISIYLLILSRSISDHLLSYAIHVWPEFICNKVIFMFMFSLAFFGHRLKILTHKIISRKVSQV